MSWFTKRITLWVAIVLGLVVVGMLALAYFVESMELGTAGEWIGGVLVGAALLVAVHEVANEAAQRRRDVVLARDSEARRVWLQEIGELNEREEGGWWTNYTINVTNSGADPIHDAFLEVALSRTLSEDDEDIGVELDDIEPVGGLDVYYPEDPPNASALVNGFIGTLGPGQLTTARFRTTTATITDLIELAWTDVWGTGRSLKIEEGMITYGES